MNRQQLRTISVILFPLIAFGCTEQDTVDLADESTDTGDAGDAGEVGESPNSGEDHEGPTVDILQLPSTLRSATELQVRAEAHDPSGISVVEFYLDDELISSDELSPYAATVLISDASSNGERSLTARAYDSSGNMAESSIPMSIELPESGAVEWEYLGPGAGRRWVAVGAEDSAMVVGEHDMLHISAKGELLSTWSFTFDVGAVTASKDGGVIALGAAGETLVIQRFTSEGVPMTPNFIDGWGSANMLITDVELGDDDRLVISSVSPFNGVDTARVSSVLFGDTVTHEWHRFLMRDGKPTNNNRVTHVAVSPNGTIYSTPTFEAAEFEVYLQLRRIEHDGHSGWTFENMIDSQSSYNDIVATEQGVFVAARMDGEAVIGRFDAEDQPNALIHVDAIEAFVLEPVDGDLVYAAFMQDKSTKLGRISPEGEERWSTRLGGGDLVQDIAMTSIGHMYVVSEWVPDAWRLRRVHP